MSDAPDFRELVGDGLGPEEEARLRHVHELLVSAGPPPELPPALLQPPPERHAKVIAFPVRRRLGTMLVLAAALAAAAFGGGYLAGHRSAAFRAEGAPIVMRGQTTAQLASIRLGPRDAGGNWPLQLRVEGLPTLPRGAYYELLLSRGGKLGPSCGTFRVRTSGVTEVRLNAPYSLRDWNGWVVVEHLPGRVESGPILST